MEYLQSTQQDGGEKCKYIRNKSIFSCSESELQLHVSIEMSLKIIS